MSTKIKTDASNVSFVKDDFTADVVTIEKDGKETKALQLVAKPERVIEEYKSNLPEEITLEQVVAIGQFTKQFLNKTVETSGTIATDAFNADKTLDRVNLNYAGVAGVKANEYNIAIDKSKTFINLKDPENPIVGPGLTVGVKDISCIITGSVKTRVKDYLKENICS